MKIQTTISIVLALGSLLAAGCASSTAPSARLPIYNLSEAEKVASNRLPEVGEASKFQRYSPQVLRNERLDEGYETSGPPTVTFSNPEATAGGYAEGTYLGGPAGYGYYNWGNWGHGNYRGFAVRGNGGGGWNYGRGGDYHP